MKDCYCLHEAYVQYTTQRAAVYYNDRGYITEYFPVSASSGAV